MKQDCQNKLFLYCDGGSRGNPGPSAYGFFITDGKHRLLYQEGNNIGYATNNIAEYTAVVKALEHILDHLQQFSSVSKILVFLDSLLVVSQLNGLYKIKQPHLRELLFVIRQKEQQIGKPILYSHIPREKNKSADKLVNAALDNKTTTSVQ